MEPSEFLGLTKGCAVDVKLFDGSLIQLCLNDLNAYNDIDKCFVSRTGIKIPISKIDTVELHSMPETAVHPLNKNKSYGTNMKYLRTFIIVCLLAFTAFPVIAENVDFTVDGFDYSITSTTSLTVEVVSGPNQAVVTIPSSVVFKNRTFRVTGISYDAFQNYTKLRSVDMPSITYIQDGYYNRYDGRPKGAFTGCSNLSDVNMPVATSIGDYAFSGCNALASISLPAATTIDYGAFSDCNSLTSVSLPAATSIGDYAFSSCDALTSISLPVATSIGDNAFYDCKALASISLPAATSIGDIAFCECKSLASVSLPAATSIGSDAFGGCETLTSVSLPAATSIGWEVFQGCKTLTSVSLPVAASIGERAFEGCNALASVSLPAATSIGDYAFQDCEALTSVSLPVATTIGSKAFSDCSSLCDIYVGDQPAQCSDDTFSKITYATATLHVPVGCASKYKAARTWNNFAFISEDYDPTGIKSTKVNDVKICTDNGSVQLTGLKEGEKVLFYSLDGKLIGAQKANSGTISITTSEPVVICKMGGKNIKILVK